jgi:hypothetical protein
VPALERAVALEEMDHVAVAISEHLDLDMSRGQNVFFDQHARVAEGVLGFALRRFERRLELGDLVDPPHPLAAAPRHRLDQHRVADLIRLLAQELGLLAAAVVARYDRHAGLRGETLRAVL